MSQSGVGERVEVRAKSLELLQSSQVRQADIGGAVCPKSRLRRFFSPPTTARLVSEVFVSLNRSECKFSRSFMKAIPRSMIIVTPRSRMCSVFMVPINRSASSVTRDRYRPRLLTEHKRAMWRMPSSPIRLSSSEIDSSCSRAASGRRLSFGMKLPSSTISLSPVR